MNGSDGEIYGYRISVVLTTQGEAKREAEHTAGSPSRFERIEADQTQQYNSQRFTRPQLYYLLLYITITNVVEPLLPGNPTLQTNT